MPRNSLDINSYVQLLLDDDLRPVARDRQQVVYGYPNERQVYEDPLLPGKQVVIAAGTVGQPNVIAEANNYIANLAAAAKFSIDKDNKTDKALRKKAIDKLAAHFRQLIQKHINPQEASGDLFKSIKQNKNFLVNFHKAREVLSLYTQVIGKATGQKLKDLENAGHQLRSQNRATLIHRFTAPQAKEGEEQFIIYIPCSRYTQRQQALMGKKASANRDHDTTSHNRADLVLGNSSMARMITGTRHQDGTVTILHDSFTGPGARMPYADFKGANSYKKLALKAITLINQEEIIQTLAQRQIDRMSDEELAAKIPQQNRQEPPDDKQEARKRLVEAYLTSPGFKLNVTECYTQVVTAGQKVAAENQHEQFQYVRQMMDAFDGAKVPVTIQTGDNSEIEVQVGYKARMSSWGVNWFSKLGKHNPLNDSSITKEQNARFINQMTKDLISHLQAIENELPGSQNINKLYRLLSNPGVHEIEVKIDKPQKNLQALKPEYRNALFAYFREYNKGKTRWNQEALDQLKEKVESLEKRINGFEQRIYQRNLEIEERRKAYYETNKTSIRKRLDELKAELEPFLISSATNPQEKAKLQHFYNSCAYLIHAQELYYEDSWHKNENNFKLQTLMASLAEELDYANTKGCKSNNDRGQRLVQKIAGNIFWTKMSPSGLYTREFLDQKRKHQDRVSDIEILDRQLTTIQALHHTANTGVSGGKFDVDKASFADNGLYGTIAALAKVKDMRPDNAVTKNLTWKLGMSAGIGLFFAGLVIILGLFVPPVGLAIAATGVSLAAIAAIVAVASFFSALTVGTVFTLIQNKLHDRKMQAWADKGLELAQREASALISTNNGNMHQGLNVKLRSLTENKAALQDPSSPRPRARITQHDEEENENLIRLSCST